MPERPAALVNLSGLREKHDPVARNLVTIWRSELLALIEVAEASYAFLASDYEPQAHQRLNAALDLIDFGADRALAQAWGDYLDRHRDEIAENFERAAELIRAGDTHGLAEHVGRNRRARAEAAASDSHAASDHDRAEESDYFGIGPFENVDDAQKHRSERPNDADA
jgi:hypothetical protein